MRVVLTVVQGRGVPRVVEFDAPSIDAAREQAQAQGLSVLSTRTRGQGGEVRQRLDLVVFVGQLRDLLSAGLSVVEALDALQRGARGAAAQAIASLQRQLREGRTLSRALASTPGFPPLLVALVQASELTSDLPRSLSRFLAHEQRVAEVRHRVVSASIYPLLLTGVGALVLLFLLFYVVPRFSHIFEGMGTQLPWSARLMVAWSRSLDAHAAWWAGFGLSALAALAAAAFSPAVRTAALRRALSVGTLGEYLRLHYLARWYEATGMLVQGGIPLMQALPLAGALLPEPLRTRSKHVEDAIARGLSPAAAHAAAGLATPVAEQLLLAGERTGDLGSVLTRIAGYHEGEVGRALERAMRVLEPLVMVFIGLSVGVVVVLMYMPIFELASAID